MTVLEELDKLKSGKYAHAADCRQAIRAIDEILGRASPEAIERGVPIRRGVKSKPLGQLSILTTQFPNNRTILPNHLNDNKIINDIYCLKKTLENQRVVLVTKDVNMRLKAKGCGIETEDYHCDHVVSDVNLLNKGYFEFEGDFWGLIDKVDSSHKDGFTYHQIPKIAPLHEAQPNEYILDRQGLVARIIKVHENYLDLLHLNHHNLMERGVVE